MSEKLTREFSGRQFVAGEVTAIRAFKVDTFGRLCSPSYGEFVFKPGLNHAKCPMQELDGKHRVAQLGCSCGFYAYYTSGANPYHRQNTVEAIVHASGLVTHGTKGIQAERLRIVGVIDPSTHTAPLDRLSRWMNKTTTDGIFGPVAAVAAIVSLIASGVAASTISPWFFLGFLVTAACVVIFHAALGAIDYSLTDAPLARDRIDLVRRNYPDIEFYTSRKDALKAHPLTQPPEPVAPSPTDDDFWTRSAS